MPEGDAIYRAARTLDRALTGRAVMRFESMYPALTRVNDDRPLAGRAIERVYSEGKHLLVQFSGDLVLLTHMRMNGSWHIYRRGERWFRPRRDMRIVIETDAYVAVGFNIPIAEFHTAHSLARSRVQALGPDLLAPGFDPKKAVARLEARSDMTIAEALLDQRALAGIGNVYKSEVLFLCRVLPSRKIGDLGRDELQTIVETAQRLMRVNVEAGTPAAIVTYRGLRPSTTRSAPGDNLWVYGRAGKPCRKCGTSIEVRKTGLDARSTYWCPQCQC
jgi:endonuclease-8